MKKHKNLVQYCLVCQIKVVSSKLDPLTFSEVPKTVFVWSVIAFYSTRVVTTLTVVDCGSPRLLCLIMKKSRSNEI